LHERQKTLTRPPPAIDRSDPVGARPPRRALRSLGQARRAIITARPRPPHPARANTIASSAAPATPLAAPAPSPAAAEGRLPAPILRARLLPALPSLGIGAVWTIVVCWFAIGEHATFNSTSRDVGVYLQMLWSTPHGRPFWNTLLESNRIHLAEHVALLLPALGPAFALVPDARWLFVAQSLVLALAATPVYLLARRLLGGVLLPTLLVAGYFAMPTVAEVAFDAIYPVTWSALPLGFAAYFLLTERYRRGAALALLALVIEEETGMLVLGLGLFLLLRRRTRRLGAALAGAGALWLLLIALVVMPRFHDPTTLPREAGNRTVGHFDALRAAPLATIATILTDRAPTAARWLLAPTGGVALLAPHVLLIDAPQAGVLLLADKERFRRHWASPMLPVIWLATTVGLASLRRPPLRALGVAALVAGTAATYALDSNLPFGGDYDPADLAWTDRSEQMAYAVARVQPGARVAASRRALGHLADRPELYVFPPSYLGALWPPERRPDTYVLDLSNDGTREALAGRQSPLRTARAPYAIWLVGPDAALLTERPPAPSLRVDRDAGGITLAGLDARRNGSYLDVTLHWAAPRRPDARLTRVVLVTDGEGRALAGSRGTALDDLFPTTEWPNGQVLLERIRVPLGGVAPARVQAGWAPPGRQPTRVDVALP
jgi:uncharacterized membrane protein